MKYGKQGILAFGLGLAILSVPFFALAAAPVCGQKAGTTLYSARFEWKGAAHAGKAMRLVIAKNTHPRYTDSRVFARIMNGDRCEAICRVQNLELKQSTAARPGTSQLASIDLSCKSAAFGALSAPATVFFNANQPELKGSILRFGSWIEGYEQAVLRIETDRRAQLLKELAPEPVKLARSR